jgi:hypothetical protein
LIGLDELLEKRKEVISELPDLPKELTELSEDKKDFLEACNKWQDFLFDKNREEKKHDIKITLLDSDAGKEFTVMYIEGLSDRQSSRLRFRFSGSSYKEAQGEWIVKSSPKIKIEALDDTGGEKKEWNLTGGDVALPAYVFTRGERTDRLNNKEWDLKIELSGLKDNIINLNITWDQSIPETIKWPELQ